jgi:uncharacterized membrane protein (UPF0127 family)
MTPAQSPGHFAPCRPPRPCRSYPTSATSRTFRLAAALSPGAAGAHGLRTLAAIGIALVMAAFTPVPAQAQPAEPNPPLPHVFLQAGIHRIKAEVARSQLERSRGLMLRKSLQPNSGMLFEFERAAMHCFWMKNTLIPLTIAFLDDDGTIVTLADMQPHDESSHCPEKPVRRALEMEQGWFKAKGLKVGDRIK